MTDQAPELLPFAQYRRKQIAELRPWEPGDDMANVSISAPDEEAGSPKAGDMIARNPKNHLDQWLVAAAYFAANFETIGPTPSERPVAQVREVLEMAAQYILSLTYGLEEHSRRKAMLDKIDAALTSERPSEAPDNLPEQLRHIATWIKSDISVNAENHAALEIAAREIERLRGGERPSESAVAWRTPLKTGYQLTSHKDVADQWRDNRAIVEPLYAIPHEEAVAYMATTENGNIRLWSKKPEVVKAFAEEKGLRFVPLYAIPHGDAERAGQAAIDCIRRLARCNINNPGQRELAGDDILSTLQRIEAFTLASERVSERETMTSVPADRVIGELPSEQVWAPISELPETDPSFLGKGVRLLLFSPQFGIRTGEAFNAHGRKWANVGNLHGNAIDDWGATHWMYLPPQPPDDSPVLKKDERSGPVSSLQSQPSKE